MDDGFDICALESLDKTPEKSFSPTKLIDSDEDSPSAPFVMTSLVHNRIVLADDVTTMLDAAKAGSSPVLLASSSGTCSKSTLPFRRWNSMVEPQRTLSSPGSERKSSGLFANFTSPVSRGFFKRPADFAAAVAVDRDPKSECKRNLSVPASPKPASAAELIDACVSGFHDSQNLTADGKLQLALPTIPGNASNGDLNNIDCKVLADLVNGLYKDQVASYRIVDARYKYEFDGGHIRGAENFGRWDETTFVGEFFPETIGPKSTDATDKENADPAGTVSPKRHILVFHCEFSSVRGPALLRLLRNKDRALNKDTYPALHYPEVYLLHQGYKEFFSQFPELCEPQSYVQMADPKFTSLERQFHKRSKTWAEGGTGTVARTKLMKRGRSCEDTEASSCLKRKSLFR